MDLDLFISLMFSFSLANMSQTLILTSLGPSFLILRARTFYPLCIPVTTNLILLQARGKGETDEELVLILYVTMVWFWSNHFTPRCPSFLVWVLESWVLNWDNACEVHITVGDWAYGESSIQKTTQVHETEDTEVCYFDGVWKQDLLENSLPNPDLRTGL